MQRQVSLWLIFFYIEEDFQNFIFGLTLQFVSYLIHTYKIYLNSFVTRCHACIFGSIL